MSDLNRQSQSSEDELRDQLSILKCDLETAKANNQALWLLLDEISNRIQISLAGIKAAVTSLLDYDILWDGSTKHDFLEIIDDNVDMISKKIVLFTIASKNQTDKLELVLEPNSIEEILSHVVDVIKGEYPDCEIDLSIVESGKPILVDFEYISMALILLLETFVEIQPKQKKCTIAARQLEDEWIIKFLGLNQQFKSLFSSLPEDLVSEQIWQKQILPTNKLKLFVLGRLLEPQHVCLSVEENEQQFFIRLSIPAVGEV